MLLSHHFPSMAFSSGHPSSLCKDVSCHYVSDISLIGSLFSKIRPDMLSWIVQSHSPTGQKVPELTSAEGIIKSGSLVQ